jgi:putative sporulation protein YyaC
MNDFKNELRRVIPRSLDLSNVVFVCIGTDRSSGDSLGPFVGTLLTKIGYTNVMGTLEHPCHAMNYLSLTEQVSMDKKLVVIDAALGIYTSIGRINAWRGSMSPGQGVKKDLLPIGDYSITGIVNASIQGLEFIALQGSRLSIMINMAEQIADAITHVFPLVVMSYVAAGRETG